MFYNYGHLLVLSSNWFQTGLIIHSINRVLLVFLPGISRHNYGITAHFYTHTLGTTIQCSLPEDSTKLLVAPHTNPPAKLPCKVILFFAVPVTKNGYQTKIVGGYILFLFW